MPSFILIIVVDVVDIKFQIQVEWFDKNDYKQIWWLDKKGRPRLSSLFLGLTRFILTSRSTLGLYHLREENSLISDLLHIDK